MTDRALCIFRDGQLWLDRAGTYKPAKRHEVALMAIIQSSLRCPEAQEAARQCQEALKQFAANSGQMEESA